MFGNRFCAKKIKLFKKENLGANEQPHQQFNYNVHNAPQLSI